MSLDRAPFDGRKMIFPNGGAIAVLNAYYFFFSWRKKSLVWVNPESNVRSSEYLLLVIITFLMGSCIL